MKIWQLTFLLLIGILHGCATIVNNNPQAIKVSTPENKKAIVNVKAPDTESYQTVIPDIILAQPSSFEELTIETNDPCYQPSRLTVDKSIHPAFWADIFTYFIGFPIDYFSGHMWSYDRRIQMPLIPANTTDNDCSQQITNLNTLTQIPEPRMRKHRLSAGFGSKVHSQRYEDSYSGFGPYIEYTYLLNSEFMLNARLQSNYSSEYYYDNAECGKYSCSVDVNTDQAVIALSLRHYLNTASSFYAGLGVAQVSVDQTLYDYGYDYFDSSASNTLQATTHAIFLDFGWQSRSGKVSFTVNGMLDLAELRLSSPDFYYDENDLGIYDNKFQKNKAINRFKNAGLVSNITMGFTLAF